MVWVSLEEVIVQMLNAHTHLILLDFEVASRQGIPLICFMFVFFLNHWKIGCLYTNSHSVFNQGLWSAL